MLEMSNVMMPVRAIILSIIVLSVYCKISKTKLIIIVESFIKNC